MTRHHSRSSRPSFTSLPRPDSADEPRPVAESNREASFRATRRWGEVREREALEDVREREASWIEVREREKSGE